MATVRQLIKIYGPYCFYCGIRVVVARGKVQKDNTATVDHLIPKSKGGIRTFKNSRLSCRRCNLLKADKTLKQFKAELRKNCEGNRGIDDGK